MITIKYHLVRTIFTEVYLELLMFSPKRFRESCWRISKTHFCHQHLVTYITITDFSLLLQLRGREKAFLKMSISEVNFTFEFFGWWYQQAVRYLIGQCIKPIELPAQSPAWLKIQGFGDRLTDAMVTLLRRLAMNPSMIELTSVLYFAGRISSWLNRNPSFIKSKRF